MVVEDEPNIYELLMAMFDMWGIAGRAFIDGEEAISWIDDVDRDLYKGDLPELVLLDLRLPGDVQGTDVGERLRESQKLSLVPIVVITAFTFSAEDREEIERRVQPDLWLEKPLPKFNQLQSVLEETIAKRREKTRNAAPAPVVTPRRRGPRRRTS